MLVEGDSPSGSCRNGSDCDTQAIFLFRGNTANAFKKSLSEIMENREWRDLVRVLECGIGASFDINKLYFKRINIMTDADTDGFGISSGMLAFFYLHLRPLIEQGYVYKVFTPLYHIDDKTHAYVKNKGEMVEVYHKKIMKNFSVKVEGSDKYMNKDEMYDFLIDTYDYAENLKRIAESAGRVNKFLIEVILALMVISGVVESATEYDDLEKTFSNQVFIKSFMSRIQKTFKEVVLDKQIVKGIVDGHFCSIKVSPRLITKASDLIPIYKKYGYKLMVKEKDREPVEMTIGEFLDNCTKLTPTILNRYKGLGELNGDELSDTTLSMENRISVKFTVEDAEHEMEIFRMLHGDGKTDKERRKKLIAAYKISKDDLDN